MTQPPESPLHSQAVVEYSQAMPKLRAEIHSAIKHLKAADPALASVIEAVGPYTLRLQRDRFSMLVRSIISQQISTGAARSILARLEALTAPERPSPPGLERLSDDELRSAGISPQKIGYLRDLTEKVVGGQVNLARIGRKTDAEIIAELTQVRGIGVWTAQMFLIFSLGRLDVFPYDDLGVRVAIRDMHGLPELPTRKACEPVAERWKPYASVASWYCWRNIDLKRALKAAGKGQPA